MAPRLAARWAVRAAAHLSPANTTNTTNTTTLPSLIPRIPRRTVISKAGWSTLPRRYKPTRFNQVSSGLPEPTTGHAAALKRKWQSTPVRSGALAIKKGVSAMYYENRRMAVTILQMEQVQVVANKTRAANGYWAVQVGLGQRQPGNETAPLLGYYEAKGMFPKMRLREFKVRGEEGLLPVGSQMQPDWFKVGQFVDTRSNSRGMGFAGGMKKHGFSGQEATHGNSLNHRTIGTTGPSQGGGSRVHPGKAMPGRMGNERVTVQNLRVMKVDNDLGTVVVKGHIAGPKGCLVMISDAIKKGPMIQSFVDKSKRVLDERNPNAAANLEQARTKHLEMKDARKNGKLGDLMPIPKLPFWAVRREGETRSFAEQ